MPGGGPRHPLGQTLDPGGSARIPAAACGLVAVKPTRGLLRRRDSGPGDLDRVEPLTAWPAGYGARLRTQHAAYDLVVTSALATTPRRRDWYDPFDAEQNFAQQSCHTPFPNPVNVAGLPAVVPAGTYGGFPMGVHLIGREGTEALLLRVAADLERGPAEEPEWVAHKQVPRGKLPAAAVRPGPTRAPGHQP